MGAKRPKSLAIQIILERKIMGNQLRGEGLGWGEIPTLRFCHQQLRLKKAIPLC